MLRRVIFFSFEDSPPLSWNLLCPPPRHIRLKTAFCSVLYAFFFQIASVTFFFLFFHVPVPGPFLKSPIFQIFFLKNECLNCFSPSSPRFCFDTFSGPPVRGDFPPVRLCAAAPVFPFGAHPPLTAASVFLYLPTHSLPFFLLTTFPEIRFEKVRRFFLNSDETKDPVFLFNSLSIRHSFSFLAFSRHFFLFLYTFPLFCDYLSQFPLRPI